MCPTMGSSASCTGERRPPRSWRSRDRERPRRGGVRDRRVRELKGRMVVRLGNHNYGGMGVKRKDNRWILGESQFPHLLNRVPRSRPSMTFATSTATPFPPPVVGSRPSPCGSPAFSSLLAVLPFVALLLLAAHFRLRHLLLVLRQEAFEFLQSPSFPQLAKRVPP